MSRKSDKFSLTGIPASLLIDETALTIGKVIGTGSNALVHTGLLNGSPVCVKVSCGFRSIRLFFTVTMLPRVR
jgi:hypothetical protein